MQPSDPAPSPPSAPPDSLQALDALLVERMATAETAANAQRDSEENPPAAVDRQETAPPETEADGEAAPVAETTPATTAPEEPDDEDDDEPEDDEDEPETPAPAAPTPVEQSKYSRRDAARFAQELTETRETLESTQRELENHRRQFTAQRDGDQRILRHLQKQSGYEVEDNGRFKYENLVDKARRGTATPEESEELAQMTAWHEFAAPIFRFAEESTAAGYATDWKKLGGLDGVGEDGLKKLNAAQNPIKGMQTLHELAFAAGEAKGKDANRATIARLKAEVKSLKTAKVSSSPQPAAAGGAAVPSNGSFMSRAIDPKTGLSNPDFDREVAAGKWIGIDLNSQH